MLGLGAVAVDDLVYVDRFPAPDSKQTMCVERREGGGLTGIALVAAARLGARTAYTLAELECEGVDCGPVLVRPDARPVHFCRGVSALF